MIELDVRCPAGEPVAETADSAACVCRVERTVLSVRRDPSSLKAFCLSGYTTCPTWTAEKERIWAERRQQLIDLADIDQFVG